MKFPKRFRFLPRPRRLLLWLLILVGGPLLLLGVVFASAQILQLELQIDLAMVLFAVATIVLSAGVYALIVHAQKPKDSVVVGYNYRLIQPALPLGRYSFRLEVFYELEEKGQRQKVNQGTIEMRFRRKDHPELFEWCRSQISHHLDRHRELAADRFPDSRVLLTPEPSPRELEASVVVETQAEPS